MSDANDPERNRITARIGRVAQRWREYVRRCGRADDGR